MQPWVFQPVWVQLYEKHLDFIGGIAFAQVAAGVDGLPGVTGTLEFGDAEIRFESVMRGERTFQAILAFHVDKLGDIRTVKSRTGFQFPENLQERLSISLLQWRYGAIFPEHCLFFLRCGVFETVQIREVLRYKLLCQQRNSLLLLTRLCIKAKLPLSLELFQLLPPRLFLGTLGIGFCFSNQRDTTFPFDCS